MALPYIREHLDRDALCLRYMVGSLTCFLRPVFVARHFSIEHALNCPCGGYPSIRHNELQDITATLLTQVCHSVGTEPGLQPLSGDFLITRQQIMRMKLV